VIGSPKPMNASDTESSTTAATSATRDSGVLSASFLGSARSTTASGTPTVKSRATSSRAHPLPVTMPTMLANETSVHTAPRAMAIARTMR
jgi:hypothetical protein